MAVSKDKFHRTLVRFYSVSTEEVYPHAWAVVPAAQEPNDLPFGKDELPLELWEKLCNPDNLPYRCHVYTNALDNNNNDTWKDWELE